MNREELKELGLNDEQINQVMASHGKTVNSIKQQADKVDGLESQIDDYKNQLLDRDKQLKELGEKAKGNEELVNEINKLKEDNENKQKEFDTKLAQQKKESKLEIVLRDAKAKSTVAVKALLELDTIKLDGDSLVGLKEQLEKVQEEHAYLFGEEGKLGGRNPHPSNPNNPAPTKNPFSKEHFNLTEQAKILKNDPELAKTLQAQAKN